MNQPLVSVLMTAYNREKYIGEAIESVMASTYQHWELIIVDDSSTDRTVEIARSYEAKDSRIKVYVNENNLGDYPNRNRAASYASGKYLKYVDADDMIYPYGLEQLVFYMEQFPEAGYGLCSLAQDKAHKYPFQLTPEEAYRRHYFETPIFHKAPLSAIIKRDVFDATGGFSGKRMLGDFEIWHKLSKKYNVVLMPHGIVWYREHEEQEMKDHRTDPFEPFKYILLQEEMIAGPDCPLDSSEKEKVLKKILVRKSKSILSAFKKHSFRKGVELFQNSNLNPFTIFQKGIFSKW